MRRSLGLTTAVLVSLSGPLFANGNHLGWCIGVGNPHRAPECGGSPQVGGSVPQTGGGSVPTVNQIGSTGSGTQPNPVVVTPLPIDTGTGTNPLPLPQGQPGGSSAGSTPTLVPVMVPTATPSQIPTAVPGQVPVATPGQVPTAVLTPGQVPTAVPGQVPVATPGQVPTAIPGQRPSVVPVIIPFTNPTTTTGTVTNTIPNPAMVTVPVRPHQTTPRPIPQLVPQPTPQSIAVAVPQPIPQKTPTQVSQGQVPTPNTTLVSVLRPKPRPHLVPTLSTSQGATTKHKPQVQAPAIGSQVVTKQIGRQPQHNAPRFQATNGDVIRCVASGYGKRRSVVDGEVETTGVLRHVGSVDVLGRDLPALHPRHSKCIITIKRRKD